MSISQFGKLSSHQHYKSENGCRRLSRAHPRGVLPEPFAATDSFAGKLWVISISKPTLSRGIATIDIAREFAVSPVSNIAEIRVCRACAASLRSLGRLA